MDLFGQPWGLASEGHGDAGRLSHIGTRAPPSWQGFYHAMKTGECASDREAIHLPVQCQDGAIRTFPARFVFLLDARAGAAGALVIYSRPDERAAPFAPVDRLAGD